MNNITLGGSASRLRIKNLSDKWVKQLESHKTKLSKDDKDGAFRGKVKCTNAKRETSDKVSGLWERQSLCRAVAEKGKSLSLNVLIRDRSHLGLELLGAGAQPQPARKDVGKPEFRERAGFAPWLVWLRKMG